jgi:Ca-activated chloride channel family protein
MPKHLHGVVAAAVLAGSFVAIRAEAGGQPNVCAPAANQVIVRFTYGSEKAAWIHEVTEAFNQEGQKTTSGKRICVNAIPKENDAAEVYNAPLVSWPLPAHICM